jgi:hypothetical protein
MPMYVHGALAYHCLASGYSRAQGEEPWPREIFGQQLRLAEEKAGLERLKGGVWHPYRRKWATERKDRAVVAVKAAGGWRDTSTLLTRYQHTDGECMLRVMEVPEKHRSLAQGESRETTASGQKERRLDTTKVASGLRVAPPGLEPQATGGEPQATLGSTRTLLIQRGRCNRPNSSNLLPFTRVRVTRCWSLLGFMLDFAVLYSLKCLSLHVSVYPVSESPRGCTGSTESFATPADPAATARADLEPLAGP